MFEPSSPFQRFERLSEGAARGPGVIDMKGGDVIIVQALRALKAAGALDRMAITVVMNGDEEHPGEPLAAARRALIEAATGAAAAIGFEDGDGDPRTANINAARRRVVDAAFDRHARALVADLPRRRRPGRDLRDRPRAGRVPRPGSPASPT